MDVAWIASQFPASASPTVDGHPRAVTFDAPTNPVPTRRRAITGRPRLGPRMTDEDRARLARAAEKRARKAARRLEEAAARLAALRESP